MAATTTLLGLLTPTQGTLSGTWGDSVNYGISDYVDIAIAGTLSFANDGAIILANTTGSASGNGFTTTTAQYMVIRITGTQTVTKVITGPSYSKLYMVDHAGATSAVTFKAAGQTGVTIAVGEKAFVYFNGTDYVKVASSIADGVTTIDFGSTGLTPNTATSGAVTVAGTLAIANGGTGTATPSLVQGANITISGTWPNQTIAAAAPGTGTVTSVSGTGTVNGISLSGSVTTSGSLTLGGALSGVDLTSQVTGTLPVANGGTGAATLTSNNVLLGNGTSALQVVAPGTAGNILTSDGSTWASTAPAGGVPVGTEALWPTNTPPTGWLQENGASLSRTGTYAALFAVIGTTYGTANGSSFNLPDARGRFVRVWNNGAGIDPDAGSRTIPATSGATMSAGDNVGTNQAQDVISHTHLIPGANAGVGSGSGGFPLAARNDSNIFTGAYGGSETRPVNTYRMMIIKY
jgi:microcystin-dependent protein